MANSTVRVSSNAPPKTATGLLPRKKQKAHRSIIRESPACSNPGSFDGAAFGFGALSTANQTKFNANFRNTRQST